jgi:hypothetical protein
MKALLILAIATCASASISMPIPPDSLPGSFLTGGTNDAFSSVCIDAVLAHCQVSFNAYLNITDQADWTQPGLLSHALDQYFLMGVPGLLTVCNARTLFYQCLGTSYNSCINRLYFLQKGYSMQAAYGYVQIMKELEFTCGGGFLQAVRSWACILNVRAQYQQTFVDCFNAFNATITANPDNICSAAQALAFCFRFPYIVHCGGEVGWWECERVRLAFELGSQCQNLQCNIGSQRNNENELIVSKGDAPVKPFNINVFSQRLFKEYERMANNVPHSKEEMKLAGAQ